MLSGEAILVGGGWGTDETSSTQVLQNDGLVILDEDAKLFGVRMVTLGHRAALSNPGSRVHFHSFLPGMAYHCPWVANYKSQHVVATVHGVECRPERK